MAPAFDAGSSSRSPGASVPPTGLVVTEGNYLLLDEPRWRAVRDQVDVVWHLHLDGACAASDWSRGTSRSARPPTRRGPGYPRRRAQRPRWSRPPRPAPTRWWSSRNGPRPTALSQRRSHPVPRTLLTSLALTVSLLLDPAAAQADDRTAPPPTAPPADLPAGAGRGHRAEPSLPTPDGWPFAQRLSRTSGTGRLHDGASYWTDFVYDDKGAAMPGGFAAGHRLAGADPGRLHVPRRARPAATAPTCSSPPSARTRTRRTGASTGARWWTPSVPIAVWTFDTDDHAATGRARLARRAPASPRPASRRRWSSRAAGAWLIDLRTGTRTDVHRARRRPDGRPGARVRRRGAAQPAARRRRLAGAARRRPRLRGRPDHGRAVPRSPALPAAAAARLQPRLPRRRPGGAGPHRPDDLRAGRGLPGGGRTTRRSTSSAPTARPASSPATSGWRTTRPTPSPAATSRSSAQASTGPRCATRRSTPEPLLRGYTNRWYVSALDLGQGVVANGGGPGTGDGRAQLPRPDPAVRRLRARPTAPDRPAPADVGAALARRQPQPVRRLNPRLLQQLCECRDSVCASTLGYGPDGWYFDEAEVDYWSVWREVAPGLPPRPAAHPDHRLLDGRLGDLPARPGAPRPVRRSRHPRRSAAVRRLPRRGGPVTAAFPVAAPPTARPAPLVGNARWMPYRIGQGTEDQLVPFTSVEAAGRRFDDLGLRHRFVRYPGEDHLASRPRTASTPSSTGSAAPASCAARRPSTSPGART